MDIMTHVLEEYKVHKGLLANLAYRVQKENQLWVLLDPRGHQGLQGLVTMGVQVLQDHLDLQDPNLPHFPELEHTGPINLSVSLDLLVLLVHLEVLLSPLGSAF